MSDQHWNVFGHCPTCKALPGEPCGDLRTVCGFDQRGGLLTGRITKRAHLDREQLAQPLPVSAS